MRTWMMSLLLGCMMLQSGIVLAEDAPANLFLKEKPAGAKDVGVVKKEAKEGDEVVIRGHIGGAEKVFTDNRAQMLIASADVPEMKACLAPGEACKTPWDYCCVPQEVIVANTATVQVAGENGKPLKFNLENLNGLKPLSTVVIKGKVGKRPDQKVLIINATGIFIEPPATTPAVK